MTNFSKHLLPLALLPMSGCSLLSSILENTVEAPTVVFNEIQLSSLSLSGLDLVFSLSAYNPNSIGLTIDHIEYSVAFDGNLVGNGESVSNIPLTARSDSSFELDFSVNFSDLVGLGINAMSGDPHTVSVDAVVHIATALGDIPVRVGHTVDLEYHTYGGSNY
jgi:LEA14-like dessication related protein